MSSNIAQTAVDWLEYSKREKGKKRANQKHKKRFYNSREIFRGVINIFFKKHGKTLKHIGYFSALLADFYHLDHHGVKNIRVMVQDFIELFAFLNFLGGLIDGGAVFGIDQYAGGNFKRMDNRNAGSNEIGKGAGKASQVEFLYKGSENRHF